MLFEEDTFVSSFSAHFSFWKLVGRSWYYIFVFVREVDITISSFILVEVGFEEWEHFWMVENWCFCRRVFLINISINFSVIIFEALEFEQIIFYFSLFIEVTLYTKSSLSTYDIMSYYRVKHCIFRGQISFMW